MKNPITWQLVPCMRSKKWMMRLTCPENFHSANVPFLTFLSNFWDFKKLSCQVLLVLVLACLSEQISLTTFLSLFFFFYFSHSFSFYLLMMQLLLLLHILIIQPVWNAFSLNCSDPHSILCSLLCLHAKLHCTSVPSLPLLIPSFSKPNRERGTTGVWTASASYYSRTTTPTNTTRYVEFTPWKCMISMLHSYLFLSSYITGASSCRRSLCLRSWRCVLLETSLSSPQAQIHTALSSLLALCATLLGRTPILSPLCPLATPRLSPQPLPPLAK